MTRFAISSSDGHAGDLSSCLFAHRPFAALVGSRAFERLPGLNAMADRVAPSLEEIRGVGR